jgi:hypothetical protein
MTQEIEGKRLKDLVTVLGQLEQLHKELAALVRAKVDAMRRADVPALREHTESEQSLVNRIQQREGMRRQLMDVIGGGLGLPARSGRKLTVSQLVARVPDKQREDILAAAERLRAAVCGVAQANHLAGTIAGGLVDHLRRVFAAVKPKGERGTAYTGDGVAVAHGGDRIFEVVG